MYPFFMPATTATTTTSAAEAWVEAFTEGWRAPTGPDAFADHFEPWLDPQIRMIQPQLPELVGLADFRERFVRPVFAQFPDIHGTTRSWAANGDVIFIELRLEATIGRRPVAWTTVDKVTLNGDGK